VLLLQVRLDEGGWSEATAKATYDSILPIRNIQLVATLLAHTAYPHITNNLPLVASLVAAKMEKQHIIREEGKNIDDFV